tara:strand:+ start:681 stop:1517 length:837 start_codon:yes stop_codon:yes gene_type:complete
MKKLFYLILFFVLAGCSSNEESKSMDTSATINSATNIESLGNNIKQNQSEKKSSILIEESDSEDIIRDDSKPIVLAQTNLLSKKDWEFKESEHFMRLVPAQPTIGGPDKVEVTEFFYYGCIHCMTFEPYINDWKKDIPDNVRFERIPALWNPLLRLHGRMYFTKEILTENGKLKDPEGFRARVFREWHNKKNYMSSAEAIQEIFLEFGVSEDDFKKTFESFQVAQKLRLADDLARRYGIASTPTMVVNGKYRTGAGEAGSYPKLMRVIDELIERESMN